MIGPDSIEIAWLDASLAEPGWPREYRQVFAYLAAARAAKPRFVATGRSIERWEWDAQAITLTIQATLDLTASLPTDHELDASVRDMMRMHAKLGWGCEIGLRLHTRGFLVSLAGDPIYGGVCLEAVSERAAEFPVLRSSIDEGRAVFHVLPVQVPFLRLDPGTREITKDMVVPEARQDWPMSALAAAAGIRGAMYAHFSTIVRDSQLRTVLEACAIPLA